MVFSSLTFVAFFLPLIVLLYFISENPSWRNGVLLVFSLIFYAWGEPVWICAMFFTVTVNYVCARLIDATEKKSLRILWLVLGVGVSLGFLFYFKYSGFVIDNLSMLLGKQNEFASPALPIGISFYTFQVITYTVDVYKGKSPVQKSYAKLLLYVSFFPQLIAGPIVNYTDIATYLGSRKIRLKDFYEGFMRFFIGFSKKVLIANTCGVIVDKIDGVSEMSLMGAWTLAIAYTLQIYFDFSGYSDMAIGMGRMFGFRFLENFNYPYISKSVTEFWRRWHISLGSFFREYVYIPLGGNRVSKGRLLCNLMVVWMLTGVWHGASWNFILWGLYYGVLLVLEKFFLMKIKERLPGCINVVITLFLVMVGWILFYYVDLNAGLQHLAIMFGVSASPLTDVVTTYYLKHYLVFVIAGIIASVPWKAVVAGWMGPQRLEKYRGNIEFFATIFKPLVTTILFLASMSVLIGQSYNPFLYFRF